MDLTKKEKYIIAEFLYSYGSDILIKSDAENVIEMFKKRGVKQAFKIEVEATATIILIRANLNICDRDEIMKDYYTGKLG